ncbi:hypothetical protein HDE77_001328 [Rhodanobacter sp. MP7CTX1]|jgi:hypothetical protein|nr:hypothetical protein [Rhodanobacter sp. MP7CTX1]
MSGSSSSPPLPCVQGHPMVVLLTQVSTPCSAPTIDSIVRPEFQDFGIGIKHRN